LPQDWLREKNPLWRMVGRVTFHLAENKRDESYPFAFMATNDVRLCGALAEIDAETGRAISIERIEVQGEASEQAYDSDDARPGNSLPAD
jgi:hypothetical protein